MPVIDQAHLFSRPSNVTLDRLLCTPSHACWPRSLNNRLNRKLDLLSIFIFRSLNLKPAPTRDWSVSSLNCCSSLIHGLLSKHLSEPRSGLAILHFKLQTLSVESNSTMIFIFESLSLKPASDYWGSVSSLPFLKPRPLNRSSKCSAPSQDFSVSSLHSLDLNLLMTSNTASQVDRRISSLLNLKLYRLQILSDSRYVIWCTKLIAWPDAMGQIFWVSWLVRLLRHFSTAQSRSCSTASVDSRSPADILVAYPTANLVECKSAP